MKRYLAIKKWDDDYNGSAIYSLVDKNGKRYIGQAKTLQRRLESHRIYLNQAYMNPECNVDEGKKLIDAVRCGTIFSVEILRKIPWNKASYNTLRYWENYYLEKYGGIENTYNTACVPSPVWNYPPFNDVTLAIMIDDADILQKLEETGNIQGYIKSLIREDIKKEAE